MTVSVVNNSKILDTAHSVKVSSFSRGEKYNSLQYSTLFCSLKLLRLQYLYNRIFPFFLFSTLSVFIFGIPQFQRISTATISICLHVLYCLGIGVVLNELILNPIAYERKFYFHSGASFTKRYHCVEIFFNIHKIKFWSKKIKVYYL